MSKLTVARRLARSNRVPLGAVTPGTVVEMRETFFLVTNDVKNGLAQIVVVSLPGGKVSFPRREKLVRVCSARLTVEV